MAGPAPKPTKLKLLAGNPGKRRLNDREPAPAVPDRAPYAPRFLGAEAKKEWRRIAPVLLDLGLYTDLDYAALVAYCSAFGRMIEAERELGKQASPIRTTDKGYEHQTAWLSIRNAAAKEVRSLLAEFGLSPAQRSRVTAAGAGAESDLERILSGTSKRAAGGRR